ncbi:uncharacterized protein LOC125189919 [Salvia hispanica]|uniref:uncharacterized protein LOC125189919 n=1 Tax=Salvia hispanica TaxID=49212 RepID=UPI002009A64E|nr:uncharacterized protein LOC125189919 [Salvia hispanica]
MLLRIGPTSSHLLRSTPSPFTSKSLKHKNPQIEKGIDRRGRAAASEPSLQLLRGAAAAGHRTSSSALLRSRKKREGIASVNPSPSRRLLPSGVHTPPPESSRAPRPFARLLPLLLLGEARGAAASRYCISFNAVAVGLGGQQAAAKKAGVQGLFWRSKNGSFDLPLLGEGEAWLPRCCPEMACCPGPDGLI